MLAHTMCLSPATLDCCVAPLTESVFVFVLTHYQDLPGATAAVTRLCSPSHVETFIDMIIANQHFRCFPE